MSYEKAGSKESLENFNPYKPTEQKYKSKHTIRSFIKRGSLLMVSSRLPDDEISDYTPYTHQIPNQTTPGNSLEGNRRDRQRL